MSDPVARRQNQADATFYPCRFERNTICCMRLFSEDRSQGYLSLESAWLLQPWSGTVPWHPEIGHRLTVVLYVGVCVASIIGQAATFKIAPAGISS